MTPPSLKIFILSASIIAASTMMAQSSITTTPPSPNTQSGEITVPYVPSKPVPAPRSTGEPGSNYPVKPDTDPDTKGAIGTGKKNMNTKDPKFNGTRVKGGTINGTGTDSPNSGTDPLGTGK